MSKNFLCSIDKHKYWEHKYWERFMPVTNIFVCKKCQNCLQNVVFKFCENCYIFLLKLNKKYTMNPDLLEKTKDFVTNLIAPEYRKQMSNNNLDFYKINKKFFKNKKESKNTLKKVNKSVLTKKDYNKLGLYNLPKKSIKYNDILVLNNIWIDYMKDYLNIHGHSPKLPSIDEPGYETFASLVGKADFHGAKITVKQSKCPSLVDLSGIIVLDTKQTFQIVGKDNKLRTIPKNECIFIIHLNNINFLLFGKHLNIRSAERSVKKIKTMQLPDL